MIFILLSLISIPHSYTNIKFSIAMVGEIKQGKNLMGTTGRKFYMGLNSPLWAREILIGRKTRVTYSRLFN